jgi:hypothetical protein
MHVIVDEYTHFIWVILPTSKDKIFEQFIIFVYKIKNPSKLALSVVTVEINLKIQILMDFNLKRV